jgi:hypothetical protein
METHPSGRARRSVQSPRVGAGLATFRLVVLGTAAWLAIAPFAAAVASEGETAPSPEDARVANVAPFLRDGAIATLGADVVRLTATIVDADGPNDLRSATFILRDAEGLRNVQALFGAAERGAVPAWVVVEHAQGARWVAMQMADSQGPAKDVPIPREPELLPGDAGASFTEHRGGGDRASLLVYVLLGCPALIGVALIRHRGPPGS